MVSVYIEYEDGSRRAVNDFEMESSTLSEVGTNMIPVSVELNGTVFETNVFNQGYSASLYKLMNASGLSVDSFLELAVLIGVIHNKLLFC